MVKHIIPRSLNETLKYLSEGDYRVIAGGSDLMVQNRNSADLPAKLNSNMLYIFNLEELNYIHEENENIKIGSMTTYEQLLFHDLTPEILKKIIYELGSPAIRHAGTLAGNIANASPAGDSLVGLYLLDAKAVLISDQGQRIIPVSDVITDPRQTVIKGNELIKEIIIPKKKFTETSWIKVGGRQADAISKVSFAGAYVLENDVLIDIRIALGAIAPTVIRSSHIEKSLKGSRVSLSSELIDIVLKEYEMLMKPIDDQRSNKQYRKHVALNLICFFLSQIKEFL